MCLKLPQMIQMVRIYGKNTKRRKDVQETMSAARQARLMESWNIIEDTTVAHFVIPLKVNTKCFLIQWISVPMIQLATPCFSLFPIAASVGDSIQIFSGHHDIHYKNVLSCLRNSSYFLVYLLLLFQSISATGRSFSLCLTPKWSKQEDPLFQLVLQYKMERNSFSKMSHGSGFGSITDPISCGQNFELSVIKLLQCIFKTNKQNKQLLLNRIVDMVETRHFMYSSIIVSC